MNTLKGMNTRQIGIFGLAALALALTAPAQAAPDYLEGAFMVAKRDRGEEVRQDQRDARTESSPEGDKRRANPREAEREESRGYGYGYERRQQQRNENDDRPRERR